MSGDVLLCFVRRWQLKLCYLRNLFLNKLTLYVDDNCTRSITGSQLLGIIPIFPYSFNTYSNGTRHTHWSIIKRFLVDHFVIPIFPCWQYIKRCLHWIGLLELVSSATKEHDIAEQLYSVIATETSKGVSPVFCSLLLCMYSHCSFMS